MRTVVIRASRPEDMPAVAGLRVAWDAEVGRAPDDGTAPDASLVAATTAFARDHRETHRCVVAERDGRVVGMAWLALTRRPPVPGAMERWSGDLQSVYVEPSARGAGVATRMVRALLDEADARGVARVTVHSSADGLALYQRLGFAPSRVLLQRPAED